jgi:hypothetical protein
MYLACEILLCCISYIAVACLTLQFRCRFVADVRPVPVSCLVSDLCNFAHEERKECRCKILTLQKNPFRKKCKYYKKMSRNAVYEENGNRMSLSLQIIYHFHLGDSMHTATRSRIHESKWDKSLAIHSHLYKQILPPPPWAKVV